MKVTNKQDVCNLHKMVHKISRIVYSAVTEWRTRINVDLICSYLRIFVSASDQFFILDIP